MYSKLACLLTFLFLYTGVAHAQTKQTASVHQTWAGYFNQSRLSDKWGLWLDGHLRTREDFVNNLSQSIIRPGITYYVNDLTKLTVGYAYVNHFPAEAHKEISRPEHRLWQQVQWHTRYPKVRTMQWLRLEERYRRKILDSATLGKGYHFNYRLRYNFLLQVPLSKGGIAPGTLSLVANDEVHINFGKAIVYNYFDQNRFFAGLSYYVNSHDNLQVGYMNIFQQLPAGNPYRTTHAARLFYFHNLDLRKKTEMKDLQG